MENKTQKYKMVPLGSVCEMGGRNSDYFRVADYVTESEGIIAISPSNIWNNTITFDDVVFLSREAYGKSDTGTVNEGDIVLNKYCKPKTAPYRSAVAEDLPKDQIVIVNPSVILIRKITCNSKYLHLVINSSEFQRTLNTISTGSMNALSITALSKILIPLPDPDEQDRIVELLWDYQAKNSELISLLEQEIKSRTAIFEQTLNSKLWE